MSAPSAGPIDGNPAGKPVYGLLAQFEHPYQLLEAAERAKAAGYRFVSAYSPFPVEGMTEALDQVPTRLPRLTLLGGVLGGLGGYLMQYYACVISYPVNVGGRPLDSWPAFMPITFELTVLSAALFTVLGMLALNGLPMPHHPLFNVPEFKAASRDRFFLCIESRDPSFDRARTEQFLRDLHPQLVLEVPR